MRARLASLLAICTIGGLVLAGCGGRGGSGATGGAAGECARAISLATPNWVGAKANSEVFKYVAKQRLSCTVKDQELTEEAAWQAMSSGTVDLLLEDWDPDKRLKANPGTIKLGELGVVGEIFYAVPQWMADEDPTITAWSNLNRNAHRFKTAESGDKGEILAGVPGYTDYTKELVHNLGLNYTVKSAGSENGLIEAMTKAQNEKKPLLMYAWTPWYFNRNVKMARVQLPPYAPGCNEPQDKARCDYAPTPLPKIASAKFANSDHPAVKLARNFSWSADDQNQVAACIQGGRNPADCAKEWVDVNKNRVDGWVA